MAELARDCLWERRRRLFRPVRRNQRLHHCAALSITERGHRNSWSDGWETDHFEILLTTGGPHLHLEVTPDQLVRVIYQDWGTPEQSLPTTEDEREALAWFASLVAV